MFWTDSCYLREQGLSQTYSRSDWTDTEPGKFPERRPVMRCSVRVSDHHSLLTTIRCAEGESLRRTPPYCRPDGGIATEPPELHRRQRGAPGHCATWLVWVGLLTPWSEVTLRGRLAVLCCSACLAACRRCGAPMGRASHHHRWLVGRLVGRLVGCHTVVHRRQIDSEGGRPRRPGATPPHPTPPDFSLIEITLLISVTPLKSLVV